MKLALAFATSSITWFQLTGGGLIFVGVLVILTLPSLRRWRVGRANPWVIVFQLAIVATLWLGAAVTARVEPQVLFSLLALVRSGMYYLGIGIAPATPYSPSTSHGLHVVSRSEDAGQATGTEDEFPPFSLT